MERWEEPLHLGSFPARYPTFPHNATLIAHFPPLCHHHNPSCRQKCLHIACFQDLTQRAMGAHEYASGAAPLRICHVSCICTCDLRERRWGAYDRYVLSVPTAEKGPNALSSASTIKLVSQSPPAAPWAGIHADAHVSHVSGARPSRRASVAATMLAAATLLAAALGGCGSSPSGTSASPATVTPASTPLYIDAVVRPEGSLKTDATTTAHTLTGRQHPFEGLLKLLAGPTGKTPNYSPRKFEPWLGTHAGAFLSATALSHAEGLLSGATLKKLLSEGLARPGSGAARAERPAGGAQRELRTGGVGARHDRRRQGASRSWKARPTARARTRPAIAASPTRSPPTAWPRGSCTSSR